MRIYFGHSVLMCGLKNVSVVLGEATFVEFKFHITNATGPFLGNTTHKTHMHPFWCQRRRKFTNILLIISVA